MHQCRKATMFSEQSKDNIDREASHVIIINIIII
jgi:hypothetical protein